jgi:hypothetical protein
MKNARFENIFEMRFLGHYNPQAECPVKRINISITRRELALIIFFPRSGIPERDRTNDNALSF